ATQWIFEQPGVDGLRVACTGVSQGGTHSWMLPALEPRIAAAAPVCGVCTFQSVIDNIRDERYDSAWRSFLDSHSIYYYVPGHLDFFEQQDLCALVAPRPFALIGADHDNCFPLDGMREAARDLARFYRVLGRPAAFKYVEFSGEHSMPLHSRETAYNFIAAAFRAVGR
ncbi:MAG TPA: acetylxylan esterase, partial [Planctomycetota bacterium]|nr:acetylxylan esterase [Planctomycetota bacterium]